MNESETTTPPSDNPIPAGGRRIDSIVLVNTGDGKGKSSAAFGVMVRAISGDWKVGEEKVGRQLGVDWFAVGEGFTWDSDNIETDIAVAAKGWGLARDLLAAGEHQLVILDEITYLLNWGWVPVEDVVHSIADRPSHVNVICTGRDAPQALIDIADTVTEMRKVKHAYDSGVLAKKGIDY